MKEVIISKIRKIITYSAPIILLVFFTVFMYTRFNSNKYIKKDGSTELSNLTILNHEIDFSPDKDYYEIYLENGETSLAIDATTKDKSATVKIFNNEDLTKHNEVYIYVTSKNHDIKKYTIAYNNITAIKYFKNNIKDCDKVDSGYCIKFFNTDDSIEDNFLLFSYDNLTKDGYPKTNTISINDTKVFSKSIVNAVFKNFRVLDNNIIFTYNGKDIKDRIYLFAVNTKGKIILDKTIMNENKPALFIYYYKFDNDIMNIKSRYTVLTKEKLCTFNSNVVMEERYTINYSNKKFDKPKLNSSLTVGEYRLLNNIKCK